MAASGEQGSETSPVFDPGALGRVAGDYGLRLVVMFGSRAGGSLPPSAQSDLDLALLGCPASRLLECHADLSAVFRSYPLDLVRLEEADPLLRHEVMHRGVLLHGDADLFCEYRAFAFRDFVDSADLFALQHALFRKRMQRLETALRAPG
ncbi:MAG TPA: nucleotidyltransferase domain-containing protein [Gammaproteobacteria bacterium]